ncbi:MAG: aminoglycoside phosphotransferase [Deltaproteobacteria bacterium]|nr:MAG: aminoglycoside phosphotransferase [Deltaproteobacteria bacterium]
MAEWHADTSIDVDRARDLLARHLPRFAGAEVLPFGEGWDNAAFLVGGQWVFRFPRRKLGGALMHGELAVLARLPALGLPIPRPEHVVADPDDYPYPFAGYRLLPGVCGEEGAPPPASRTIARELGDFLARLHRSPLPEGLPADTLNRADLEGRAARLRERLPAARALAPDLPWTQAERLLEGIADHPPPALRCVVHGDLYPRHVLVEHDRVTGVIDWGDVHGGDPSGDLSIGWTWFDAAGRTALFAAYREAGGPVDPARLAPRARFRALQYGVFLLPYAEEAEDLGMRAIAVHAITQCAMPG